MPGIVIISPDKELARLCENVARERGSEKEVTIRIGPAEKGVAIAREEAKKNPAVFISRGGTFTMIEKARLGIPVVDIGVSYQNLIYCLWKAKSYGRSKVAIIGYKNVFLSIKKIEKYLEELTGTLIIACKVNTDDEIHGYVESVIEKEGRDNLVFIGGNKVANSAAALGCPAVALKSTEENIVSAISEAEKIVAATRSEKERANMFKAILDHISDGVLSVDRENTITVFNKAAQTMMMVEEKKILGRKVSEKLFSPRILEVVKKGKPELGVLEEIGETTVVTNSTPIFVDNQVVGAVATFQDITYLQQLEQQVRRKLSRQGLVPKYTFDNIVGESSCMKSAIQRAQKYAGTDYTILLTAETGSGKEMFAHSIHGSSRRKKGPFVTVNCASLPESLLEAELFGYSEGAFTGASRGGHAGLFEQAHGGTIFLDEVGEISGRLQVLFLRVLQEKEIRRIGDNKIIPVDVRIISASNRTLKELVSRGEFREDLYYRLNVLNLSIPPLRDRRSDIPLLINHFLKLFPAALGAGLSISKEALSSLQDYDWPGNVRQLENILQRLIVISEDESLISNADVEEALEGDLTPGKQRAETGRKESGSNEGQDCATGMKRTLEEETLQQLIQASAAEEREKGLLWALENEMIKRVLREVKGNRQEAARILGMSSTTLWRRIKKLNWEGEEG